MNDFSEEDYVVMASYLVSTDTYEKMNANVLPAIEEKYETLEKKQEMPVNQDQVRISPL